MGAVAVIPFHMTWIQRSIYSRELLEKGYGEGQMVEGLKNMKEIVEVEGIDGLFVRPSDLSIALGYPLTDPLQPEMQKAIEEILDAAHGAGKRCTIFYFNSNQGYLWAKQGFDMSNQDIVWL
ncbi:hypothetical protein D9758_007391 [Tetrapyrgos nigripes]|uniref:HpcH/HpaI aldolase/citrate lyase domain-containing protein n=1 Tax=Tetrapyrgos nigripes TaxID=182062 RepID=A0A8H5LLL1_9AGAR|nr:hypothetical protein D9758_007391 [Tetrapyrgos nigripes]